MLPTTRLELFAGIPVIGCAEARPWYDRLLGSPPAFLVAWVGVRCAVYLLSGAIADRSLAEFLNRRRRWLNAHGIRWHDCLADERRCEL